MTIGFERRPSTERWRPDRNRCRRACSGWSTFHIGSYSSQWTGKVKTLIVENRHIGHYYLYLHYILPRLADLVETVDVAITSEGRSSSEFQTYLAPLDDRVAFHPVLFSRRIRQTACGCT